MAQPRGRNEQRHMYLITLEPFDYLRSKLRCDTFSVRDVAADAPPNIIEAADHSVIRVFRKAIYRDQRVSIQIHIFRIVAFRRITQVSGLDLDRYFAHTHIAITRLNIKRLSAVDICTGR